VQLGERGPRLADGGQVRHDHGDGVGPDLAAAEQVEQRAVAGPRRGVGDPDPLPGARGGEDRVAAAMGDQVHELADRRAVDRARRVELGEPAVGQLTGDGVVHQRPEQEVGAGVLEHGGREPLVPGVPLTHQQRGQHLPADIVVQHRAPSASAHEPSRCRRSTSA
jgi:hypothetical protein